MTHPDVPNTPGEPGYTPPPPPSGHAPAPRDDESGDPEVRSGGSHDTPTQAFAPPPYGSHGATPASAPPYGAHGSTAATPPPYDASGTPGYGSAGYGSTGYGTSDPSAYPSPAYGQQASYGQGAPYGQDAAGYTPGYEAPRRSGLALAALIVGVVSLLLAVIPLINAFSILGGIAAVVVGIMALRRLTPQVSGKGLAVAGIVTGALGALVAIVMWILVGFAIASFEEGDLGPVLEEMSTDFEPEP